MGTTQELQEKCSIVLIFSYWNVNYIHHYNNLRKTQVLIFSYWNVNIIGERKITSIESVLIFSYWNVNRVAEIRKIAIYQY